MKTVNVILFSEMIDSVFRDEIFYPSMRALAKQMGKEHQYEGLISGSRSLLPPPGAPEVDVKAWQVQAQQKLHT